MFNDSINSAASRTLSQGNPQLCEQSLFARGYNFNVSLIGVLHPAAQTKFSRLAMHEPAKANTLYTAFDQEMEDHNATKPD
jgi:hypothetical protein